MEKTMDDRIYHCGSWFTSIDSLRGLTILAIFITLFCLIGAVTFAKFGYDVIRSGMTMFEDWSLLALLALLSVGLGVLAYFAGSEGICYLSY